MSEVKEKLSDSIKLMEAAQVYIEFGHYVVKDLLEEALEEIETAEETEAALRATIETLEKELEEAQNEL